MEERGIRFSHHGNLGKTRGIERGSPRRRRRGAPWSPMASKVESWERSLGRTFFFLGS